MNGDQPTSEEQIADVALGRFVSRHPELRQNTIVTEIPTSIRWLGVIIGAVMTALIIAGAQSLVTSSSEMQVTLARLDERIGSWIRTQDDRYAALDRRVERLEQQEKEDR